jgi:hypothetical protein
LTQLPDIFTHCLLNNVPFIVSVISLFLDLVLIALQILKTRSQPAFEWGKTKNIYYK